MTIAKDVTLEAVASKLQDLSVSIAPEHPLKQEEHEITKEGTEIVKVSIIEEPKAPIVN